jgi:CRISPR-associated protein Cas5d
MKGFCLEVFGEYACFTRPEMKVERVSYDVITPSAARAIFEAILWKPAIRWRITKIEVLAPIRWISVRRNEVGKVASPRSDGIIVENDRQQRAGLLLRDVKYRLHGEFDFIPPERHAQVHNPVPEWLVDVEETEALRQPDVRPDESEAKYAAMFDRRASKGQCFNQPYLGCREFSCEFKLVKNGSGGSQQSIDETRDLGWMLYDVNFSDPADPQPMWFRPIMERGVIAVPHPDSEEVRK